MALEDALAVVELTACIVDLTHLLAVKELHAFDTLRDRMPISTRVAVDRGADRAGNARQRLESLQSGRNGEIDQRLQWRAGVSRHPRAFDLQRARREPQNHAAETAVRDDDVAAVTQDVVREAPLPAHPHSLGKGLGDGGFGKHIGHAADAKTRAAAQLDLFADRQTGNFGERGVDSVGAGFGSLAGQGGRRWHGLKIHSAGQQPVANRGLGTVSPFSRQARRYKLLISCGREKR